VSKSDGFGIVFVVQVVPTQREQMNENLVHEIKRAIHRKQKKLKAAKERGERTVLLLDSDDYALVNWQMLADAFADAVGADESVFEGIDDVYIQHRGGGCWIFPVKLAERMYPQLLEFEEYWNRQAELLGVH
jgi:hypothetical protein